MSNTRARWQIVRGRKVYILNGVDAEALTQAKDVHPDMTIGEICVLHAHPDGCPYLYGEYAGRDYEGFYYTPENPEPQPYCFKMVAAPGDQCDNGKSMNKIIMLPFGLVQSAKKEESHAPAVAA